MHNEGQLIQTSLLDPSVFVNPTIVSAYLNKEKNIRLIGNDHPYIAPYTVYKIKEGVNGEEDSTIAIGVALDSQFNKLIEVLGLSNNNKDKTDKFHFALFSSNKKRIENT